MRNYINVKSYTDIRSYLITDIDEAKGTAKAIEVEKNCKHECEAGGFAANFSNLDEEFANCEPTIVKNAKEFEIIKRNGTWGHWESIVLATNIPTECLANLEELKAQGTAKIEIDNGLATIFETTKGGKRKHTFEKMGQIETECRYFYDYNF